MCVREVGEVFLGHAESYRGTTRAGAVGSPAMQRQTAQLVACAIVLVAAVVAGVVWYRGAQQRAPDPYGAEDRGGGATLDPSHYIRRTAVVRDSLNGLANDARAGVGHEEYAGRLADATAAVVTW